MKKTRFYAQQLFDGHRFFEKRVLTVVDGKITAIDENINEYDVSLIGLVVPGFIDLQVNGGGGALFNDEPSIDNIKIIMSAHSVFGTTAMMPTLITDKVEVMQKAADAIAQAIAEDVAGIIGIHFEGPHLSVDKKGTHCEDYIRAISDAEWQVFSRQDIGLVMVTVAPETVSSDDIKRMVNLGIKVSLGHSNADYHTVVQAIASGATGFTHLFNAMSPLQGREPGMVGAALLNNDTTCGLIVDGFHVDYASCRLAITSKPQGKVFLVTDAMPPVGTDLTQFSLYDRTVFVENGKLTSSTGELAGSSLTMQKAVKNTYEYVGVDLAEALRMASLYPANFISEGKKNIRGELTLGKSADMLVLDDNLDVKENWIAGKNVFHSSD